MTIQIFIGSSSEITARLAGAPSATTTTLSAVASAKIFTLANPASFAAGQSVVLNMEKAVINTLVGSVATLTGNLAAVPSIGLIIRHYDADYSTYRNPEKELSFQDDLKTGGNTGDSFGNDIEILERNRTMARPLTGSRLLIVDSADPTTPLFAGVITNAARVLIGCDNNRALYMGWGLQAKGFQYEADSVGIEEEPVFNVNAGQFLQLLMERYTNLTVGEIDIVNSPRVDYIRLSNYRRFASVGVDLSALWPGSEFFISNDLTGGKVYFRQAQTVNTTFTLDESFLLAKGPLNVKITHDQEKTYNIIRLPFFMLQPREPDFFIQDTVVDSAFLKTSVTLNGQPASIDESLLLLEDFTDGTLGDEWFEDDLTNAGTVPTGFTAADGYLIEGVNNTVTGLHMLSTALNVPAVKLGDIGRVTDPTFIAPFTGAERQEILAKEIVVNALGDGVIIGITDPTTIQTTTLAGSTTTVLNVPSTSGFVANDRVTVGVQKCYVSSIAAGVINISPAIVGAPPLGTVVTKHRMAASRVNFGIIFKTAGDLKYIKNGVESAFAVPRTYTAVTTYSLRLYMQAFETTITTVSSSIQLILSDTTNFAVNDVIEIYSSDSRNDPEERVILTKVGTTITFPALSGTPKVGYRVRTKPKICVQIKGGTFGLITGRTWTEIHQEANTWQTVAGTAPINSAVALCMPVSLVGTISLFKMRNPPSVTANIGTRFLHMGTQEVESSEPDIDAIIRKVGSHYQLDFFPDTKALWASGTRLELRYNERFEYHLEDKDTASMTMLATSRGFTVSPGTTEADLVRMGGKALDTLQILQNPIALNEAIVQSKAIMDSVKSDAVSSSINTNSVLDGIPKSGQTIPSTLSGVADMVIQRVKFTEIAGAKDISNGGSAVFGLTIVAGTIDRLSDLLLRREIKNGNRVVLDDGVQTDSFTKIQKNNINEIAQTVELFTVSTCTNPTRIVWDGTSYVGLRCLLIA